MKIFKKRNKYLILGIIILVLLIAVGTSYAVYRLYIKGEDTSIQGTSSNFFPEQQQGKSQTFSFPTYDLVLETGETDYINAVDLLPIPYYEVNSSSEMSFFRIINTSDSAKIYSINLVDLTVSANLQVDDFKWELYNNNDEIIVAFGTFVNAGTSTLNLIKDVNIPLNYAHEYILKIWIEETQEDQSALLNGTFSGKISIDSSISEPLPLN